MKRDFSAPILDLHGKPLVEAISLQALQRALARLAPGIAEQVLEVLQAEGVRAVTLADLAAAALIAGYEDERGLPLEEKVKRTQLALRVVAGGEVELGIKDAELIERLVNKRYPDALKPARVHELLEAEHPANG